MPVRFRCRSCNRLLGIARRKIGTEINCPQCGVSLTVPDRDDAAEAAATVGAPPADQDLGLEIELLQPPRPVSPPAAPPAPRAAATRPAPPTAAQPRRRPGEDPPLFEGDDFDALLGLGPKGGEKLSLDDGPAPRKATTSGADAMSLEEPARPLVLSPQRATLLFVGVVILLGLAFAAGFLIASKS